jgi:uncharacterized membrane protein
MLFKRLARHLLTSRATVNRHFPPSCIAALRQAIAASETTHRGEIRFAIEAALPPLRVLRDVSARERALELFSDLRVWDTADNSGVLVYVLLADRAIEIVADRGINLRTADGTWLRIAQAMQEAFSHGRYEAGALAGIGAISQELARHLPPSNGNPNELSDDITLL